MSEVVIRVENLYKEYRLGTISHGTLYRDLQSWWANLRGKEDPNSLLSSSYSEKAADNNKHFYALEDISFDVKQGEIVGIIGRNGAGKSTLLKVLSKVTAPTKGSVKIKGRVASLLEVGTGFHSELTGRENIYLNGTILGMNRKEIGAKFEEIVDFAELEEFVDTPVKRYSSGMYVRLAFAVAAYLEPEILLVDEVLAVGDAAFQKKCLGKMGEVAEGGRTVLFVSHNIGAIRQLCSRSILLDKGKVELIGLTDEVVNSYLNYEQDKAGAEFRWNFDDAPGDEFARLVSIRVCSIGGESRSEFGTNEQIVVEVNYKILKRLSIFRIGFSLHSSDGTYIFYTADDDMPSYSGQSRDPGEYISRCQIPANWLNNGLYYLFISGGIFGVRVVFKDIPTLKINIISTGGPTARFNEKRNGILCPSLIWVIDNLNKKITFDFSKNEVLYEKI